MKNRIWKYRIEVVFSIILMMQVPFVLIKLTTSARDSIDLIVEALHILISSGLAGFLFSKAFDSLLERWLYGGYLRRNWKEVRVIYSDNVFKGMGDEYPREPTLLIQPSMLKGRSSDPHKDENPLIAYSLSGKGYGITARDMHGPMTVSFNTGYVGQPAAGQDTLVTGKWSDLQLMQVDHPGIVRVGFPDTLIRLGSISSSS